MSSVNDAIKLKSLKEHTEKSDGLRILIARFRPRYLCKEYENWYVWWKELAPSRSLWKEYLKEKKINWDEYSRRYRSEILKNPLALNAIHTLDSLVDDRPAVLNPDENQQFRNEFLHSNQRYEISSRYDTVALLCHCKDENRCHRYLDKEMVRQQI